MESNKRREEIKSILAESSTPVSAARLADKLRVSRQIIVGDVALLRAAGCNVEATPRGYIIRDEKKDTANEKHVLLVCRHGAEKTEDELNILVDNGCRVLDVIVEHPVYGQLTGILDIASRYDVKNFVQKIKKSDAHSLCELTDGMHIHTVEYTDEDAFKLAKKELKKAGILYE